MKKGHPSVYLGFGIWDLGCQISVQSPKSDIPNPKYTEGGSFLIYT
jgi:hypothetical protein